jgi:hypothetical protein
VKKQNSSPYGLSANVTIYQLVCKDENIKGVFVEHTSMKVQNAMKIHKLVCHNRDHKSYDNPLYKQIRGNGGWDNWYHLALEICPSIDKEQALAKKREWIQKASNAMNERRPITSYEQDTINHSKNKDDNRERSVIYRKDNTDLISEKRKLSYAVDRGTLKERSKVYRDDHKENIKAQRRVYLEANKDFIKEQQRAYYETNREVIIERTKLYQELNKDRLIEYRKTYKEANYDKILEQRKVRYAINKHEINERRRESRRLKKLIE